MEDPQVKIFDVLMIKLNQPPLHKNKL